MWITTGSHSPIQWFWVLLGLKDQTGLHQLDTVEKSLQGHFHVAFSPKAARYAVQYLQNCATVMNDNKTHIWLNLNFKLFANWRSSSNQFQIHYQQIIITTQAKNSKATSKRNTTTGIFAEDHLLGSPLNDSHNKQWPSTHILNLAYITTALVDLPKTPVVTCTLVANLLPAVINIKTISLQQYKKHSWDSKHLPRPYNSPQEQFSTANIYWYKFL